MEHAQTKDRTCPRCQKHVGVQRHEAAEGGITWLWRCPCGWCGAVTESGIMTRDRVRKAIALAQAEQARKRATG